MRIPLVCVFTAGIAAAQGSWSFVASAGSPPDTSPAMAFDATRGVTVETGYGASVTQVWERAGANWSLRGGSLPTTRRFHDAAAFDSGRGVTVILPGGNTPDSGLGGLAEWTGSLWTTPGLQSQPPVRTRHALAYDAARGVTVMFGGGHAASGTLSFRQDTWTWDGSNWAQRFPLSFPAVRGGHAMAYDSARQRVVMFGGTTAGVDATNRPPEVFHGDTWEWDGSNWFERTPLGSTPGARHEHAMAYDPVARVTYLFGGLDPSGTPLNDLWVFDGASWTRLVTLNPPARRFDCGMAFDTARGKLVLFGGQNTTWAQYVRDWSSAPGLRDTWEYTPGVIGSFTPFGVGCAGSRGVPALRLQGSPPTAGQPLRVQVDNLPLVGPAFVFVGASNSLYGVLPLPFPLGGIGMTGCTLYASGDALVAVQNVLGTALLNLDLPLSTVGSSVYLQAFPFDPVANPLGLTASHGAHVQIGG